MIRKFEKSDLDRIAAIWLDSNIKVHNFIPADYWKGNFNKVKADLLQAEVYVYEDCGRILGFVGLQGNYIAGVFVRDDVRSRGIGSQLLEYLRNSKNDLNLRVYKKNTGAVRFYLREHFKISLTQTDKDTGEEEYLMIWDNQCPA